MRRRHCWKIEEACAGVDRRFFDAAELGSIDDRRATSD